MSDDTYRRLDGTEVHDGDAIVPITRREGHVPGFPARKTDPPNQSLPDACLSCGEGMRRNDCPASKRECGHHCNCSWIHDDCHWCARQFGEQTQDEAAEPKRRTFIHDYTKSADPALRVAAMLMLGTPEAATRLIDRYYIGADETREAVRHIEKAWQDLRAADETEEPPVASSAHRGRTLVSLTTTPSTHLSRVGRGFNLFAVESANRIASLSDPQDVRAVNAVLIKHPTQGAEVRAQGQTPGEIATRLVRRWTRGGSVEPGLALRQRLEGIGEGKAPGVTDPIANAQLAAKLYMENNTKDLGSWKAPDHRLDLFRYPVDLGDPGMDDDDPVGSLEGPGRVPPGLDLTEVLRRAGVPLRRRPDPVWARRREARDRREARRG